MADDIDKTAEKQEIYDRYLLAAGRHRKPELPPANGRCFFCDEPVLTGKRYCDSDCADMHTKELQRKTRR